MKNFSMTIFLALTGFTYSQSAAAYLDPGAGSLMLQMLIAGIMGALFTIKLYWYRLKAFIARMLGRESDIELDACDTSITEVDDGK